MDDPMADRIDRPEAGNGPGELPGLHAPSRCRQVGRAHDLVGRVEDAQLQAARAGIDDQDPLERHAAAYPGHAQLAISGSSSPSRRV